MKPLHGGLAAALLLTLTASAADAQLTSGKTAPGGVTLKQASVPSVLKSRLTRSVTKSGKTMTGQQIIDSFDPDSKVKLASGKEISFQELLDRVGRAETSISSQGGSLTGLKKKSWLSATTPTRLSTQRAALSGDLSTTRARAASSSTLATAARTPRDCTASTCYPTDKENQVSWDKQIGDEDIAAAYTKFSVKSVTPDSYTTVCAASWDNGVYILKKRNSLLKFTGDVKSTKKAPAGWTASAALYTLGNASPVWSKEGKISASALDRTFSTPKVSLKYVIVPGLNIEGELQATATLTFTPTADGTPPSDGVQCTLGLTPRLTGKVDGAAKLVLGIPDLIELAEGGVKGSVTVVDAQVPTNLTINMTQDPLALKLNFKSDLNTTFMKGRVYGYYKIQDVCLLGWCAIEDGLGINPYGEIDLWEDTDGIKYDTNLIDKSGAIQFTKG